MDEVYKAIQQTVGPELKLLKQDVKKRWPEEDPELLLMQWLCERNGLKMPQKQSAQTEMLVPTPPKSMPPFRRPPGLNSARIGGSPRNTMGAIEPVQETTLPKLTPRQMLPSPKVTLHSNQLLEEELNTTRDFARLRTAVPIHEKVLDDAQRFCVTQNAIKGSDERVAGTIAKLRTDLRGKFICKIPILSANVLTEADQYWLVGKLTPWTYEAGEIIMQQGEPGDKLYIIERGSCEIIVDGRVLDTIGREAFFGELAVIYAGPRTATVRAKTGVTLLSLSRDDLFNTIGDEKVKKLAVVARTRMFSSIPLLSKLSPKKKEHVTSKLIQQSFSAGTVIARQGEMVQNSRRRMHIVEDGHCRKEVQASHASEEGKTGVEMLRRGGFFNMFAMYYGCPVGATVTAETDVTTLSISYDELMDICISEHQEEERKREAEIRTIRRKASGIHAPLPAQMAAAAEKAEKRNSLTSSRRGSKLRKDSTKFMSNPTSLLDQLDAMPVDDSNSKARVETDLKHIEQELRSETLKAIRDSMFKHLLTLFFVKVNRNDIANNPKLLDICRQHASEKAFDRWDTIFSKGAVVDMVYILETGALAENVRDLTTLTDANEVNQETERTAEHYIPGTFFGSECMTTREPVSKSTLAATSDCTMLCVPGDILRRLLRGGSKTGELSSRLDLE
mmetsp:Transcript_42196/g.78965  ORF Transcript_42196/g.78965 Transcript_42196/m.78965 type:complete len:675 (-) Transcript_42196:40-2064(-)